ncbi:CAZyme family GH71 [Penicillium roqueforti]|nr:CAZyme family GH71 [Penicillium roqueforti]
MRLSSLLAVALLGHCQVQAAAVFAHFMLMNAENYTVTDWQTDIQAALDAHINAFALNMAAAYDKHFLLFFSFDYAGNGPWKAGDVAALLEQYTASTAYYLYKGQYIVSTFEGPAHAEDWIDLKQQYNVFFVPDWSSIGAKPASQLGGGVADALFSWAGWPWGPQDMDTYTDASYYQYLNESGSKPYMMAVSPWFFTNLPGYDKNWLWRGDDLWYDRWVEVLYNQPEFVEIISWNDYGESHYIGPLYDYAMEAFTIRKAPRWLGTSAAYYRYCPEGACVEAGSKSSGEVYVPPGIWDNIDPEVQCILLCKIILPPFPLGSTTTIQFPSMLHAGVVGACAFGRRSSLLPSSIGQRNAGTRLPRGPLHCYLPALGHEVDFIEPAVVPTVANFLVDATRQTQSMIVVFMAAEEDAAFKAVTSPVATGSSGGSGGGGSDSGSSSSGGSADGQQANLPMDYDGPDGLANGEWNPTPILVEDAAAVTSGMSAIMAQGTPCFESALSLLTASQTVPADLYSTVHASATSLKQSMSTQISDLKDKINAADPENFQAVTSWFTTWQDDFNVRVDSMIQGIEEPYAEIELQVSLGRAQDDVDIFSEAASIEANEDICEINPNMGSSTHPITRKRAIPPSCAPDFQGDPGEPSNAAKIPEWIGCDTRLGFEYASSADILGAMKQGIKYFLSNARGVPRSGQPDWQTAAKAAYPHIYSNSDNIDFSDECMNAGGDYTGFIEFPIMPDGSILEAGRNSRIDVGVQRVVFKAKASRDRAATDWSYLYCGVMSHFTNLLETHIIDGEPKRVLPFKLCEATCASDVVGQCSWMWA